MQLGARSAKDRCEATSRMPSGKSAPLLCANRDRAIHSFGSARCWVPGGPVLRWGKATSAAACHNRPARGRCRAVVGGDLGGRQRAGSDCARAACSAPAAGVYTLVLVYLLRYGVDAIGSEWAERLPSLPKLNEPGGRLGLTIIFAFCLCRATVRTEQVEAARRGEELRLDDGSTSDEDSPQHKGLLKAPYVRMMIFFLTPIYKELRRKTGWSAPTGRPASTRRCANESARRTPGPGWPTTATTTSWPSPTRSWTPSSEPAAPSRSWSRTPTRTWPR